MFDFSMMMEEIIVVTNWGKVVDFATLHYIVENYIEEAKRKRMDPLAYLIVVAAIVGAD